MRLRSTRTIVVVASVAATLALGYALRRTYPIIEMTRYFEGKLPLVLALGGLLALAIVAVLGMMYGFGLEGRLARSGKLHDLTK